MDTAVVRMGAGTRVSLRVLGIILLVVGVAMVAAAISSMLDWQTTLGRGPLAPPENFWMGFVGIPLLAIGAALAWIGFLKPVSEVVATETEGAVTVTAGAVGRGLRGAGVGGATIIKVKCRHCGNLETEDAKFCSNCGKTL